MKCKCDNCNKTYDSRDIKGLEFCADLGERLDPGSVVPAGECPDCGAFVYNQRPVGIRIELLIDEESVPYGAQVTVENDSAGEYSARFVNTYFARGYARSLALQLDGEVIE